MLVIFAFFLLLSQINLAYSEVQRPIRSIEYYDEGPFMITKFNKDACHTLDIFMTVSCNDMYYDTHGYKYKKLGDIYIDYGNETVYVKQLWHQFYTSDNKSYVSNNIFNTKLTINNNHEYLPKLMIKKGDMCKNNPLSIKIYKFNKMETSCNDVTNLLHKLKFIIYIYALIGSIMCLYDAFMR